MEIFEFRFDPGPVFGLIVLFGMVAVGFIIWMLIDAIARPESDFTSPGAKTGWIVGLVLGLFLGFGFIGFIVALIYFFTVRLPAGGGGARPALSPSGGGPSPDPDDPSRGSPAYCASCGAKLVAGAQFCHSCGARTTRPEER